jgi:tRNA threonylcarbamoyladenosine biosynthesis protein TsaE
LTSDFLLPEAEATARLGRALAPRLAAGDLVALTGELGAGKSALARAVIGARLAALGRAEDIPSPSYTLAQVYDLGEVDIWHADLYRLGAVEEIAELGLEEAFEKAICLVEWADRLGAALPPRRLDVALAFSPAGPDARLVSVAAHGPDWDWVAAALAAARDEGEAA